MTRTIVLWTFAVLLLPLTVAVLVVGTIGWGVLRIIDEVLPREEP